VAPQPPRSSTVADAPTSELGTVHRIPVSIGPFGGVAIDERELQRDLAWPRSVKTYEAMPNDAHIDGMRRAFTLAIRAYHWWLDPNGARPEVVQRISADYNLPIGPDGEINLRRGQRRFNFDKHLEDALRAPFGPGHRFFEQVYDVRRDGDPNVNAGWVAHLRKLADRPPRTISEIKTERDGGLMHIKVPPLRDGVRSGPLGLGQDVPIPVDRLIAYVWDQEGANWRGRSMLRPLYRPWKMKDRVMRVGAINIDRAGGIPYANAPEGVTTPQQMQEVDAILAAWRVGDESRAVLPYGWQLKFAQAAGGDQAVQFVRLQNEEMSRAWLLMVMNLGQTESGARALGETMIDLAELAEQAVAKWFAGVFSEHQLEDDVELNEGPGEEYAPILRFTPRGDALAPLEEAVEEAERAGALPEGSRLAASVRGGRQGAGGRSARRPFPGQAAAGERRELLPQEEHVDWEDLEDRWTAARAALVAEWLVVRERQIEELQAAIEDADGDIGQLAALAVAASSDDARVIAERLRELAEYGVSTARGEATAQGASLPSPDLVETVERLDVRAVAVADLLSRALSEAAGRQAVQRTGGALPPADVASEVAEHLRGLSNAYLEEQLGGALTQGMNTGRRVAMGGAPVGTRFFGSALLDVNVCDPCREDDGREFDSLLEAELTYPVGGNKDCQGGVRCRCTIVATYPESAPSVD
jgi:hypothetical protein